MIKHFCLLFKNLMSLNLSNIYTSGELLSLETDQINEWFWWCRRCLIMFTNKDPPLLHAVIDNLVKQLWASPLTLHCFHLFHHHGHDHNIKHHLHIWWFSCNFWINNLKSRFQILNWQPYLIFLLQFSGSLVGIPLLVLEIHTFRFIWWKLWQWWQCWQWWQSQSCDNDNGNDIDAGDDNNGDNDDNDNIRCV